MSSDIADAMSRSNSAPGSPASEVPLGITQESQQEGEQREKASLGTVLKTLSSTRQTTPNNFRSGTRRIDTKTEPTISSSQRLDINTNPWRTWPELTLKIHRLPSAATLADLHKSFSRHGNITMLEIGENKDGYHNGFAKVRFEPPPETNFWSSINYNIKFGAGQRARITLALFVPKLKFDDLTPSPANPKVQLRTRTVLKVQQMDFGSLLQETDMMVHKSVNDNVKIDVDLGRKQLTVTFDIPKRAHQNVEAVVSGVGAQDVEDDNFHRYRCNIAFARITKLFRTKTEEGATALVIPLELPPIYRTKRDDKSLAAMAEGRLFWGTLDMWERRTIILKDNRLPSNFPVTLQTDFDDPGYINIGRWTTLRFMVGDEDNSLDEALEALHAYNIEATLSNFKFTPHRPALLATLYRASKTQGKEEGTSTGLSLQSLASSLESPPALDFQVHYQLEVCISRGIICEYAITREFLERLAAVNKDRAKWTLEYFADREKRVWDLNDIFEDEEANLHFPNPLMPRYCTTIRKVVVTPTTVYYSSPGVESSNRVLRKFSEDQDRFLRVQFTDELYYGKIYSDSGEELFSRVYRTLAKGITIGSRHYEFLAFGNSQIRECAVYFFCPTDHRSCDYIRDWMGDFGHIKNVAKYAARIGQCFSTTREIPGTTVANIVPIEDVERNGFCFSDGVGKISQLLAHIVVVEMSSDDACISVPSAFQFRMGGCKGMLAVWPDAKRQEVHIRPSQEKFKATFNGLEIIKYAQHSIATLNRQTITVLTSLGVRAETILKLAERQIKNYQKAMNDRVAAASLLGHYIDENLTSLTIKDLVGWGFMDPEIQEPFVLTILDLWRIWSMKLLKEKARVIVEESAFLLGCLDETGSLRGYSTATEGKKTNNIEDLPQVFLQVESPSGSGKFTCVTGLCIVGRNPSLHPGDLRVVEAVDVPQLHHLRNVVVFPRNGDRDVPSMMSGGDLDGDDFFVMWNQDLIPKDWHQPPMNYTQPTPAVLRRDVQVKDLRTFFVRYMQNDSLALIATAHLAHADKSLLGVKDQKCLQLAALHSKAVDYVKTGDPAKLPPALNPKERPHFLGSRGQTYHSSTALGKLYDMIQDVGFNPLYEKRFDNRVLNRFHLTEDLLSKARAVKVQYDMAMRRLMGQRDIDTEFEIWTGFALSKPRVGSDYKQQEEIGRESSLLKHRFREICYQEAGGSRVFDNIGPFVAAMYKVTQDEVNAALAGEYEDEEHKRQSMPLISFPWIFHWIMGRIATGKVKTTPTINPEAAPITKKTYHAPHGTVEAEPATQIEDGREVHRGEMLRLFDNSPTDRNSDEVSVSSKTEDATGGEEVHVEDEDNPMDRMAALMSGARG
ncbi:suppressor of ascus dominance [Colletotrichum chrysophilum]|uniref:RNA-dependent RNA polymerase n=1 Tax=Colletotrichum chrysophilum TaxID=1836956 RepID=A0AAD9A6N1_9PEZI|nr:suppressor of ascus dominance [Colletotrichum chrysophilum]